MLGSIKENILALADTVKHVTDPADDEFCKGLTRELRAWQQNIESFKTSSGLVNPLHCKPLSEFDVHRLCQSLTSLNYV